MEAPRSVVITYALAPAGTRSVTTRTVVSVVQFAGYELPGTGLGKDIVRRIERRVRVSDLMRPPIDRRLRMEDRAATPRSPGEVGELAACVVGDSHRSVPAGADAMTSETSTWVE